MGKIERGMCNVVSCDFLYPFDGLGYGSNFAVVEQAPPSAHSHKLGIVSRNNQLSAILLLVCLQASRRPKKRWFSLVESNSLMNLMR